MLGRWIASIVLVMTSQRHEEGSVGAYPMVVVFGRPGAGKTTVANAALAKLDDIKKESSIEGNADGSSSQKKLQNLECVGLDLDVCVPQWMKDNFSNGIYPTLEERIDFAVNACDYVDEQIRELKQNIEKTERNKNSVPSSIISFSFVNTDLRDKFRSRFPNAAWVLIDTDDAEATKRINEREDHFYKGKDPLKDEGTTSTTTSDNTESNVEPSEENDGDNADWLFAPVTFPHHTLQGKNAIDKNADSVLEVLFDQMESQIRN